MRVRLMCGDMTKTVFSLCDVDILMRDTARIMVAKVADLGMGMCGTMYFKPPVMPDVLVVVCDDMLAAKVAVFADI